MFRIGKALGKRGMTRLGFEGRVEGGAKKGMDPTSLRMTLQFGRQHSWVQIRDPLASSDQHVSELHA